MDKVYIISGLLSFLSFPLIAQNSDYQAQYREKVLEYNQDLKAAGYNEAMKQEMIKSARADFKPKLSAGGNFNYTGNPLELSIDLPSIRAEIWGDSLPITTDLYRRRHSCQLPKSTEGKRVGIQ